MLNVIIFFMTATTSWLIHHLAHWIDDNCLIGTTTFPRRWLCLQRNEKWTPMWETCLQRFIAILRLVVYFKNMLSIDPLSIHIYWSCRSPLTRESKSASPSQNCTHRLKSLNQRRDIWKLFSKEIQIREKDLDCWAMWVIDWLLIW